MMKNYLIIGLLFFVLDCKSNGLEDFKADLIDYEYMNILFSISYFYDRVFKNKKELKDTTIYDFDAKTIEGNDYDFSSLKGKKVLVVNTASKCGLTSQYRDLQKLYDTYKDKNFEIIAFPANNFAKQEPGTNKEIKQFCATNFNVSFVLMEKISVKGKDKHPLYKWLTSKNGYDVKWNFQKFMINEQGKLVGVVYPMASPLSVKILNWIKND